MPRIVALVLLALAVSFSSRADRILETVLDPANPQQQNARWGSHLLIAGHSDPYMLRYDDETFTQLNYPIVGGTQLRFDSYHNPITHYNLALYFTLVGTPGSAAPRYLYRYMGSTFTRITISGNILSNCKVYNGLLYFISDVSGTKRLFRFNGSTVTEVMGAFIPNATSYQLFVAEGNLFMTGAAAGSGTSNFIRRYNGTSFITLWTGSGTNPNEVIGVPGTGRAYFVGHERILHFNASSISQVFNNPGETIYPKLWRGSLYFTTGVGAEPSRSNRLYRITGASVTLMTLPTGWQVAPVPHTNPEVYMDNLYFGATHTSGIKRVLRYDGTTFSSFFIISDPLINSGVGLFIRDGNLMIHPNYVNGVHAYEYNGSEFTEIIAPTGRLLFPYINGTDCNYLWLNYYTDATGIKWAYAKEDRGCPPSGGAVVVIPDHFADYERVDVTISGRDRGWCWNEIIIDWEIEPVCELPPCPLPNYKFSMLDPNNGAAWSQQFNTPSFFQVPLPDQQPFRLVLASLDIQKDLLVFEPDLLPMGIEEIKLNMKPKQNYFMLTASTRNNSQVPLKATLLNASGKVLWEQTFTAPFSQQITATVQEPGAMLIFSIPGMGSKLITQAEPCPESFLR